MSIITNVKYVRDFDKGIVDVYYTNNGIEHRLICPINVTDDFFPKPTNKDEIIIRESYGSINNDNA